MKSNLTLWHSLTLLALILPSVYLYWVWPALPAQIPTHFGGGGANGYTAKDSVWLLCLGLPAGTYLLLTLLPRLDPKGRVDAANPNFQKLRLLLVALLGALSCQSLYVALHPGAAAEKGVFLLVAGFFGLLGNYLTTVPPNYFVGIRTPWTLELPLVWQQTHRLGGRLFFWGGLLAVLAVLALPPAVSSIVLGSIIGFVSVVSYGYSYVAYRRALKTTIR